MMARLGLACAVALTSTAAAMATTYPHECLRNNFIVIQLLFGQSILNPGPSVGKGNGLSIGYLRGFLRRFLTFYRPLFFFITSAIRTGGPPCLLLSSAASIKANISIVSSGFTGGTPLWKNFIISTTRGA